MTEPAPIPNLFQRLRDVKLELGGTIEKGGTAPREMGGFAFIEWDDVADRVGMLLANHGVEFLPSITASDVVVCGQTSTNKDMFRATVTLSIELINVDKPEDRAVATWVGIGDDVGDKAVQKAATSALKYFTIRKLLLGGVAGTVTDTDATNPDGTAAPATVERALCEQCKAAGFKSKKGYPPRYWPNRSGDGFQCDGIDANGRYQNHVPATQPPRPGSAPMMSEAERQEQATHPPVGVPALPMSGTPTQQVPPAAPPPQDTAGNGGNHQGAGSPSPAPVAPSPDSVPRLTLLNETTEAIRVLPSGWPQKMAKTLVDENGLVDFAKGMTPTALKKLDDERLTFIRNWAIVLKDSAASGQDPWQGNPVAVAQDIDPDQIPF